MWVTFIIVAIIVFVCYKFLVGDFDKFVAGFNSLSKKEQEKYDISKVRQYMALYCFVFGFLLIFYSMALIDTAAQSLLIDTLVFVGAVFVLTVVILILLNTKAKNKNKK